MILPPEINVAEMTRIASLLLPLVIALARPAASQPTETAPPPPPGTATHRCGADVCAIRVEVTDCSSAGGIRLDRPVVEARDVARLQWNLVTPGFSFAVPALRIDAPDGEFEAQPADAPNQLQLHNRNSIMGEFLYVYTLTVQGCRPVKGWIRNVAL